METSNCPTIADRARACGIRFNALASEAGQAVPEFEDQLARFNIWCANLGAFAGAHASLDYRVRNSQKAKAMMLQLLQTLQRKLQYAMNTWERQRENSGESTWEAETGFDDTDSTSTASSDSSQNFVPQRHESVLTRNVKDIEAVINRLHRLGMSLRKTSAHNRNLKATKFALLDENGDDISQHFGTFALRVVQAKFPVANSILHERIANLILSRRKTFCYQQRHQQKLAVASLPPPDHAFKHHPSNLSAAAQLRRTAQSGGLSTYNARQSGLAMSKPLSATTATALSAKSILSRPAPSIALSSAVSSAADTTTVSFPPPPSIGPNVKEFQCPYCGLLLDCKDRNPRRWRKHLIHDLEPYLCLFENCNTTGESFRTIDSWIEHSRSHTLRWYCGVSSCQNQSFVKQAMFEDHMKLAHPGTFGPAQLDMLVDSMKRPAQAIFEHCALCNYTPNLQEALSGQVKSDHIVKTNSLHKHIAGHLEEIALFSLPWQNDTDGISCASDTRSRCGGSVKQNGVSDLDQASLNFNDTPELDHSSTSYEVPAEGPLPSEVIDATQDESRDAEWGFMPLPPYSGHSEDNILRTLVRKHLDTYVDTPDLMQTASPGDAADKEQAQAIFNWISMSSAAAAHQHIASERQEKMCEWVLQNANVGNFIANKGASLWAFGIPGSGKTLLSSAIIDHLKHSAPRRAAVTYVYCDHRHQEPLTALRLISCLLRQVVEVFWRNNTTIPTEVQSLYETYAEMGGPQSMIMLLKMLESAVPGCEDVFVIVDALDECPYQTRKEFIQSITSIQPAIHLLITSRYSADINVLLEDVPTVEVSASDDNLISYARNCISTYPVLQTQFDNLSDQAKTQLLDKIPQMSEKMFPVVRILVQAWARSPGGLEGGAPSLENISREMNSFYNEHLERLFRISPPSSALAVKTLLWVVFGKHPLTAAEIVDAIGARVHSELITSCNKFVNDSELLLTICGGIIKIDSKTGVVHPFHGTLKEHLHLNHKVLWEWPQENITECCLDYLLKEEFKMGPCMSNEDMLARLQKHPFLRYAACCWGYHAKGRVEVAYAEAIITFLNNQLAVESSVQAKNMPHDCHSYPKNVDSEAYPHGVPGIALAAYFGLASIVKAMLDKRRDEATLTDIEQALFWAATGGSVDVVKLLLALGVSPNIPGLMRTAAENGHEEVIKALAVNGGDINASGQADDGNALQIAAIKGNESLIRCLLEHGADPNIGSEELGSVLHIAAVNGDEGITQLLLENGADPNTKGGMYGFALQAAVEEGHERIVRMLLDKNADVNLEGGPYGNAFQAAAENGDTDIVELLLAHGANINKMIGGEKYTALQEVARRGSETMTEFLIDRGANLESKQRNGQTVLHQAAKEDQAGVVALLLRKGANPTVKDQRGFTALDWAKKKGFSEVVKILEGA